MPLGDLPLVYYAFMFTVLLLGIKRYSKPGPNLDSIPTVGFSGPILSYITAIQFLFHGEKFIQEGYDKYKGGLFKIAMLDHWEVIASGHQTIEDIRKAPDDVLSMMNATVRLLQADYTLGPETSRNPYHVNLIRNQLTRSLKDYFPELHEEIVASFDDFIPAKDEWVSYPAREALMQIVCRTINRIFVGFPKCRDPDYCELNINFTTDVVKSASIINLFPDVFKPLVGPLFSRITSSVRRATHHLAPIIENRRAKLHDLGDDWNDKPNDMLMWLMKEAQGDERSVQKLALRILAVNFAAILTSSMSMTQALYDLAANPQCVPDLREEIQSVVAADGWTKLAMNKMRKVDSFLRECQRSSVTMQRVAVKPFAFSNGLTIPAGTNLSCALAPTHRDAENYTNAEVFDPWRFAAMREDEGEGNKYQLVSTSPEYLAFGHGRHACPGRFFVANEMKAILAHIVVNYDVKFEDGLTSPPKLCVGSLLLPGKAKVMFRKRQV